MNPLAPKAEMFAFLITEENKAELAEDIDPKDVMSASNLPGDPTTFVPGYYAVFRLIQADDPFVESLGNRFYSVWITSPDLFKSKFLILESNSIYKDRLNIRLK